MSITNLTLGPHWGDEWPDHVDVSHEGKDDFVRYVPERTCQMIDNGCELCCSECDARHEYDMEPNYCSCCGAKVIG